MHTMLLLITSLASADDRGPSPSCPPSEPKIIHCPAPSALHGTELKAGYVEFEFTVDIDGTVSDIEVIAADQRQRYNATAAKALAQWRFQPVKKALRKSQRFQFEIEG
jgi:TonB family protein